MRVAVEATLLPPGPANRQAPGFCVGALGLAGLRGRR